METLYVIDNPCKSEEMTVKGMLYEGLGHFCTGNNATHYILSFRRGTPRDETRLLVSRFLEKLTDAAGIHPSRLAVVGLMVTEPESHAHLIAISDKDKRTGKSIRNMSLPTVQALFDWWSTVAGSNVASRKVYDAESLCGYHASWQNAIRTGQKGEVFLHGRSFIKRLEKRQAKRERRK